MSLFALKMIVRQVQGLSGPGSQQAIYPAGTTGAAKTVNFGLATFQRLEVDADTTLTLTGPVAECTVLGLWIRNTTGSSWNVTWPATVEGVPPVSVAAGASVYVDLRKVVDKYVVIGFVVYT